jgi:hypothetical protein
MIKFDTQNRVVVSIQCLLCQLFREAHGHYLIVYIKSHTQKPQKHSSFTYPRGQQSSSTLLPVCKTSGSPLVFTNVHLRVHPCYISLPYLGYSETSVSVSVSVPCSSCQWCRNPPHRASQLFQSWRKYFRNRQ